MKTTFYYSVIAFAVLALLFVSCNKKDENISSSAIGKTKITLHNLEEVTAKLSNDKKVNTRDIELFINGLTRLGGVKDSIVGRTVADIVNSQEAFLKARASKVLENSGARINLFLNHNFKYVGIQFNDADPKNKINNIVFDVKNTSDKPIKKIAGRLNFYLPNGKLVKIYNLSTSTELPNDAEKPMRFSMPFKNDDKSQRDKIVRTSKDLKAVWTPTLLEFSDGSKIVDKATENNK